MKWVFIIFLFFSSRLFCQTNLVPNSSFENCTTCPPNGFAPIGGQFIPNNGELLGWFNPNAHSPDYFSWIGEPNLNQLQTPHFDSSYVGIATYDPNESNQREYISIQLSDSLVTNKYYYIEFYTSVGNHFSIFTANNLAINLSDTALHSSNLNYFNVPASLKYFNNEVIEDTLNWIKFSGYYHALGGEKFLTIGNFNTDDETTQGIQFPNGIGWQAYYLIDDVSVIPLDSIVGGISINAGPDQTVYIGDTAFIGEKITNLPANWFKLDGTQVATNTSGLYVSPEETTTYVVTMTLNGFYSTDTVTVFVEGVGIEEKENEVFRIYPVPNNGEFTLSGDLELGYKVQVKSVEGKLVFEEIIKETSSMINLKTLLSSGTYTIELINKENVVIFNQKTLIVR